MLRLLVEGDRADPKLIRLEMLSEDDLFFNFSIGLDPDVFLDMKESQQLNISFP